MLRNRCKSFFFLLLACMVLAVCTPGQSTEYYEVKVQRWLKWESANAGKPNNVLGATSYQRKRVVTLDLSDDKLGIDAVDTKGTVDILKKRWPIDLYINNDNEFVFLDPKKGKVVRLSSDGQLLRSGGKWLSRLKWNGKYFIGATWNSDILVMDTKLTIITNILSYDVLKQRIDQLFSIASHPSEPDILEIDVMCHDNKLRVFSLDVGKQQTWTNNTRNADDVERSVNALFPDGNDGQYLFWGGSFSIKPFPTQPIIGTDKYGNRYVRGKYDTIHTRFNKDMDFEITIFDVDGKFIRHFQPISDPYRERDTGTPEDNVQMRFSYAVDREGVIYVMAPINGRLTIDKYTPVGK